MKQRNSTNQIKLKLINQEKTYISADCWTSSAAEKKASFCHRSKLLATIISLSFLSSTKKQKKRNSKDFWIWGKITLKEKKKKKKKKLRLFLLFLCWGEAKKEEREREQMRERETYRGDYIYFALLFCNIFGSVCFLFNHLRILFYCTRKKLVCNNNKVYITKQLKHYWDPSILFTL